MATTDPAVPAQPRPQLTEPTEPVRRGWLGYWTSAIFGVYLAYYATQQILLPRQANAIAAGDSALAVTITSYAGVAAAAVAIVVSITAGALSDRTLHSRGRRQIWVGAGALLAAAAFVAQGLQTTMLGLIITWSVFQIGFNAAYTALLAAVPDDVPVTQRATVSGFQGLGQSLGPLVGIALVGILVSGVLDGYLALALVLILFTAPFALRTRGAVLQRDQRPPLRLRSVLTDLVAPLRHADFAWAFGQRFMIQLSNALGLLFLYQYLRDAVRTDPDTGTLVLSLIYTVAVCSVAVPAGRVSDRTLKRKRMVIVSSVLMGISGLTFAFWPTMPSAMLGAAVLGLGYGFYLSVDQALVTQVLPHPEDRGKDLGVIQIANVLPAIVASALGGVLVNSAGGFTALYLSTVVTGFAAALFVAPIKSVR